MRLRSHQKLTAALAIVIGLLPISMALAQYDWLQFDGNGQHSGVNTQESLLTLSNVNGLTRRYQISLPSVADGAPAFLSSVPINNVLVDLVFVTTKDGHIIALNARTGVTVWSQQNGPGNCKINNGSSTCYTTSSPAVDPNRQYVYTYGLDGKAHKYQVADGTEITSGGWPEVTTLKAFDEKGSPALSLITANSGTSYLYVGNGGYPGDNGDYQGHVTVINLSTGAQNVFNALCSNQTVHFAETPGTPDCPAVQTAIWGRSTAVYDSATNKVYLSTGNGDFNPANHDWGDSVLALNPDGTGSNGNPLDTYTPTEFQQLQNGDADLGSTAPVIVPVPSGFPIANLGLQSGKDAKIRLLNMDNLSGQGATGKTGGELLKINVPQGNEVLTAPIAWVNPADGSTWIFVVNDNGASALKLGASGSSPTLTTQWQNTNGGASPIVANGILFYAGGGLIRALNPLTGSLIWSTSIGSTHWESPIVANGWLYVTDGSSHLSAYSLPLPTPVADTIGVYQGGTFFLRNSNTTGNADIEASLSNPFAARIPVVGDWTGSGVDLIGLFSQGQFVLRNSNTTGAPDTSFLFGTAGDTPLAGRWVYGAAADGVGVARSSNGLIFLRNILTTGFADQSGVLGIAGDQAVTGDWNGDGVDTSGVYRSSSAQFFLTDHIGGGTLTADYIFNYGRSGDVPIAGDWTASGRTGVGVYRQPNTFLLRNQLLTGGADTIVVYGLSNDQPVVGHWTTSSGSPNSPKSPTGQRPVPSAVTPIAPGSGSVSSGNGIGG